MIKSYSEMLEFESFDERLEYLKLLDNNVLSPRHMSIQFYKSHLWKVTRQSIIDRDLGFDLGVFGVYVNGGIIVHHINPIDEFDIIHQTDKLLDPENLITTSIDTHNRIHYNRNEKVEWTERTPRDTILW